MHRFLDFVAKPPSFNYLATKIIHMLVGISHRFVCLTSFLYGVPKCSHSCLNDLPHQLFTYMAFLAHVHRGALGRALVFGEMYTIKSMNASTKVARNGEYHILVSYI